MAIIIPLVSQFDNRGVSGAIKEFKNLEGAGAKASFALKKAMLPAVAVIGGLAAGAKKALDAGEAVASADARILQINKSMGLFGNSTQQVSDRLTKLAETTGRQIGVDNISIKATQAKLLTFANLAKTADKTGGAFDRATKAALDMAAAGFGTAENNAVQLGKALENPIKGITALAKSGVTFTDKEKDKIKTLVESNKMLEAQEIVLKAIEKQVGGTAAATADDSKKIGEAFAQVSQKIGQMLLPILAAVTPYLTRFADWATENSDKFLIIAGVIGGIAAAIIAVNTAMTIWSATTKAFTAIQAAFNAVLAMNPITLMVIALAALVAGLVLAYNKFEGFRNIVDSVFAFIRGGVKAGIDGITSYLQFVLGIYKGIFNGIAKLWNNTFGKLSFKVPSWVPGIGGKGFEVPNIPMLAEGGIVTQPTLALIGERGAEAVIPLSKMNQGGNIYVTVQGGDPNAIVDALRRYQRQNGAVPIRTVA